MVNTGTIKVPVLQRFIADYPEKAVDVLMRCCHDPDIEKEIVQFLLNPEQQPKNRPRNDLDTTNISNVPSTPGPMTPPGSHRSGSFSDHRRTPRSTHAASRPRPDASPTRSNSTYSKSLASKSGKEDILITAMNEDDEITKDHARMRSAQIEYSIIGEHMFFDGRICRSNIDDGIPELQITLPCRGAPGTFRNISVSSCAKLTWRRTSSESEATHKTLFYLVPQELLDMDVLLGTRDSGEGMTLSRPQKGAGLIFQECDMKASAQVANARSFHHSSHVNDNSNAYPDEVLQSLMRGQRDRVPSQRNPGSNFSNTQPSHPKHPSITGNPAPSAPPVPTNPQPDKIRLDCEIGSTALGIWLDLDGHADAFLANVDAAFRKRKLVFVQADTTILLKTDPQIPDKAGYLLILDEDDLEPDWSRTISWVRANKNAISPHIFGTIQIEND